jgi:hypothetical protein
MFIDVTVLQFIYDTDTCISFYFCCEKLKKSKYNQLCYENPVSYTNNIVL